MMTVLIERIRFYFRHSLNDLWVNGQRTLFGLFCISAGVAATVGLLTLGNMVQDTLDASVQESNRGDIRIDPSFVSEDDGETDEDTGGFTFSPQELAEIKQWFADEYDISVDDLCEDGSPVCITQLLAFQFTFASNDEAGTSTISFVYSVDSDTYPLYGKIETDDGQSLGDLIDKDSYVDNEQPADIVLSEQLADELEAGIGDEITLLGVVDKKFVITGIVPTRAEFGFTNFAASIFGYMYVDEDIEAFIDADFFSDQESDEESTEPAALGYTTIFIAVNDPENLENLSDRFNEAFPNTNTTTTDDLLDLNEALAYTITQFNSMMGLLALLIGGIGIVNTMLVVVRRRTGEIAVLKTIGLRPDEISVLFLVEAVLMGIIGSVVGIPFGFLVAYLTQGAVESFVAQDLVFRVTLQPIIIGMIVGTTVTTIFGLLPTLAAGQVRPATVLQPQMVNVPRAGIVRSFIALLVVIIALSAVAQGMLNNLLTGDDIDFLQYAAQVTLFIMGLLIGGVSFTGKEVTSGLMGIFNPILVWIVALFALSQISTSDDTTTLIIYLGGAAVLSVGWVGAWLVRRDLYPLGSLYLLIVLPILGVLLGRQLPATLGILVVFLIAGIIYMFLWALVWFIGSFFPSFRSVDLKIAMRAMLATKGRVASTLLAFIIGVFTLSLVVMLVTTIDKFVQQILEDFAGGNIIAIVADIDGDNSSLNQLEETLDAGIDGVQSYAIVREYNTELVSITDVSRNRTLDRDAIRAEIVDNLDFGTTADKNNDADAFFEAIQAINARSVDANLPNVDVVEGRQLNTNDLGTAVMMVPNGPEVEALGLSVGDRVTYRFIDANDPAIRSREITFEIVGLLANTAEIEGFGSLYYAPIDFLPVGEEIDIQPTNVAAVIEADEDKVEDVSRTLRRLDNVFVIETRLFNDIVSRVINNFTSLPIVVSIVVLITGGVVIANSVALSMLERRREIAIMKAVGLQRRRVLGMLLLENGIMGFIAGLIGVGISALILLVILIFVFQSSLGEAIPYQQAFLLMSICVLISMGAALASVWGAASEKPLNVLRYE